jgi:hypothetical protein
MGTYQMLLELLAHKLAPLVEDLGLVVLPLIRQPLYLSLRVLLDGLVNLDQITPANVVVDLETDLFECFGQGLAIHHLPNLLMAVKSVIFDFPCEISLHLQ